MLTVKNGNDKNEDINRLDLKDATPEQSPTEQSKKSKSSKKSNKLDSPRKQQRILETYGLQLK